MNIPTYIIGSVQTKAYAILREEVYAVLDKYQLTPTQWSMLGIIIESKDGIRQTEIAKNLGVKPPLITVLTKKLVSRQLIESQPNQFDTRAKLLNSTTTGRLHAKEIETALTTRLTNLLNGLTEDDIKAYHHVLSVIINNKRLNK